MKALLPSLSLLFSLPRNSLQHGVCNAKSLHTDINISELVSALDETFPECLDLSCQRYSSFSSINTTNINLLPLPPATRNQQSIQEIPNLLFLPQKLLSSSLFIHPQSFESITPTNIMSSPHSSRKPSASKKFASQSNGKDSSAWIMVAKKVTPSMNLPTILKAGSSHKTQPESAKAISVRSSASTKQPSVAKRSASQSKQVSKSRRPPTSTTSRVPSASAARTASIKRSASRKTPASEKRTSSVVRSNAGIKSASRARSEASRKKVPTAKKSASTKKPFVTVTEPVSSAKSGVVPKEQRRASTKKQSVIVTEPISSAKSGLVPKTRTENSLTHRPSSSTRALVPRHGCCQGHHRHVHPHLLMAPPPPAIVIVHHVHAAPPRPPPPPPPRPVVVMPRVSCRHCCCDIRHARVNERRIRCCFDCSTRRGHC